MRASTLLISSLLAGIVIGSTASIAQAQAGTSPNDPPSARPGAVPMYRPPLIPPQRTTVPNTVAPAGGTTWIVPGGWGNSPIIFNQPGYYPYYPGGFVSSTTVIDNGGYYYSNNSTTYTPGFDTGYGNAALTITGPDGAVRAAETIALRTALTDLTRAWEREDSTALGRHLGNGLSVAILDGDRYRYTLNGTQVSPGIAHLLRYTDTLSYRFSDARLSNDGLVQAYATHRYRTPGNRRVQTGTSRITLAYVEGAWRVSAISLPQGILTPAANQ